MAFCCGRFQVRGGVAVYKFLRIFRKNSIVPEKYNCIEV